MSHVVDLGVGAVCGCFRAPARYIVFELLPTTATASATTPSSSASSVWSDAVLRERIENFVAACAIDDADMLFHNVRGHRCVWALFALVYLFFVAWFALRRVCAMWN